MSLHTSMLWLPGALRDAGIDVWELHGWDENEAGYFWTYPDGSNDGYAGRPSGHMIHHTATTAYTPVVQDSNGKTKANAWVGMLRDGRLYQSGDGVPTVALTSGGPANYSSGYGVKAVLDDYVLPAIPMVTKQSHSDDSPQWAGNRYYWNTEVVCDGVGGSVTSQTWEILGKYVAVLNNGMDWDLNQARLIGHFQHTKRKIDYRDGRHIDALSTLLDLREKAIKATGQGDQGCPWVDHCREHYTPSFDQGMGVCNTPQTDWGFGTVDWGVSEGRWITTDGVRNYFDTVLTEGRYMSFESRA